MTLAVKIVGVLFICLGLLGAAQPNAARRAVGFFKQGKRIYLAALVRFVLAVIFLLAAHECGIPWLIGLLGVLFLVAGLVIIVTGPQRLRPIMEWFQKQSHIWIRAIGVIVLALGGLVIYAA